VAVRVGRAVRAVSSKDQRKRATPSVPREAPSEYAGEHGLRIVREFVDVETAKQAGARLRRCSPSSDAVGHGRILLIEKTDRLYRNLKDWVSVDELDT